MKLYDNIASNKLSTTIISIIAQIETVSESRGCGGMGLGLWFASSVPPVLCVGPRCFLFLDKIYSLICFPKQLHWGVNWWSIVAPPILFSLKFCTNPLSFTIISICANMWSRSLYKSEHRIWGATKAFATTTLQTPSRLYFLLPPIVNIYHLCFLPILLSTFIHFTWCKNTQWIGLFDNRS